MSLHELFYSTKTGDIQKLRNLVEDKEVDVNVRDKWDSTPLYYACLCGHQHIVQYLLEHGAKCEANTFDGERCMYGALTDDIRNLLRSYKAISSRLMRRDDFDEFLRKLLECGFHSDVEFEVHGERFPAHRCILSVRCPFFGELFRTKWQGRHSIELKHKLIYPWAFKAILQYLYTGRMEISIDFVGDCRLLAHQCQLQALEDLIDSSLKKTLDFQASKVGVVTVTTLEVQEPSLSFLLKTELGQLANSASPPPFCSWVQGELPFDQQVSQSFADIIFNVDGYQFFCHKVFFYERSDYFKALIDDHFGEASSSNSLPVITLKDITASVFHCILTYIYQDICNLTEDWTYELLCASDMYLLPGLKRLCCSVLLQTITLDNVVCLVRLARLFALPRLEAGCAEFIANNIFEVVEQQEFADLVLEDAQGVRGREETDSIDIVDEVRFYVSNIVSCMSDLQDAEDRLRIIDQLLEDLGLDA